MSAHTPGPWAVSDDAGQAVVSLGGVSVKDIVVATLPRVHHANARLIAAAPDLLAALKSLADTTQWLDVNFDDGEEEKEAEAVLTAARAAIAKAVGP